MLLLPLAERPKMYVYGAYLFYVCCSDCVGVCGNVSCVPAVVKIVFFSLRVLEYVVCLCIGCDVMDVVFSVCIVRRGAVGDRVWEV